MADEITAIFEKSLWFMKNITKVSMFLYILESSYFSLPLYQTTKILKVMLFFDNETCLILIAYCFIRINDI